MNTRHHLLVAGCLPVMAILVASCGARAVTTTPAPTAPPSSPPAQVAAGPTTAPPLDHTERAAVRYVRRKLPAFEREWALVGDALRAGRRGDWAGFEADRARGSLLWGEVVGGWYAVGRPVRGRVGDLTYHVDKLVSVEQIALTAAFAGEFTAATPDHVATATAVMQRHAAQYRAAVARVEHDLRQLGAG